MNNRKSFSVLIESILIVAFIAAFFNYVAPILKKPTKLKEMEYKIYDQELNTINAPSKLVVSEAGIALFFEDLSYAAVYSFSGDFLYGIQVDSSDRGTGNMAFIDGEWVIDSKNGTLYFFQDKTLIASYHVTINENLDLYREIRPKMGDYNSLECDYLGDNYSYSRAKHAILKNSGNVSTTVVVLIGKH